MPDYSLAVFDILYQLFDKGPGIYERIGQLEEKSCDDGDDFCDVLSKRCGLRAVPDDPADLARAVVLDEFRRAVVRSNYGTYKKTEKAVKRIRSGDIRAWGTQ